MSSHIERIKCPECGFIFDAEVQHSCPWNDMTAECPNCKYMITESEWDEVEKPQQ